MCTVVMKDKTMMALAKSGDIKVQKLLEFREWIVEESKKPENRYLRKDGKNGRLKKEFRMLLLNRLLRLQDSINSYLISRNEIDICMKLLESDKYGEYK